MSIALRSVSIFDRSADDLLRRAGSDPVCETFETLTPFLVLLFYLLLSYR